MIHRRGCLEKVASNRLPREGCTSRRLGASRRLRLGEETDEKKKEDEEEGEEDD